MYQGGIFRFVLKVSETYPNCDSPVSINIFLHFPFSDTYKVDQ